MRDWEFKDGKTDWDKTLRNWIRREDERRSGKGSSNGQRSHAAMNGLTEKEYRTIQNAQELIEEMDRDDARRPSALLQDPRSYGDYVQ
jgi:hypothetical protein